MRLPADAEQFGIYGIFIYNFIIIQAPQEIVIVLGDGDPPRQIFTDGRSLPRDPQPSWMGYSAGKWQGDTLAVETIGFNEASWLDTFGHPRSEFMRIREAYHRRDFEHMDLEVTLEDPMPPEAVARRASRSRGVFARDERFSNPHDRTRGVVHRDLKRGNVNITFSRQAVIDHGEVIR